MTLNSVLALGMHRSGTSALSGALSCLGINFVGPKDELFRSIDNPNGFFERPSILQLSDSLLETHGWSWDSVELNPLDGEKLIHLVNRGRELVDQFSSDGPVGLKDPRICLLVPFWRRALLDRFEAVVITREPAEVAWSLHVRDGLPVTVGLALWIAYNMHLANGIQGLNPHILRYENLVDSPTTELATIAQFLHERGIPVLHQQSDIEGAAKSIDPKLRRATVPNWVNAHPLTVEARAIRELFHQALGTDISIVPSELCREVLELQSLPQKLLKANHLLNLVRIEMDQIRATNDVHVAQISHDHANARALLEHQLEKQQQQIQVQENDLTNQHQALEQAAAQLEKQQQQIQVQENDLTNQHQALEQAAAQIVQMKNSKSLKIGLILTWPIRKLRPANRKR
jgi:hypothetical protein